MKHKIILLFFIMFISSGLHPIHVCLTEVNFNQQNHSLEIIHRIFWDDFERMLKRQYDQKLTLGHGAETSDAEKYIAQYLQENFTLEVNGKKYKINYLGRGYEEEVMLVYMEVPKVKKLKSAKIRHTVMHQLFDDQKNITTFIVQKEKTGAFTTPSEPTAQLSF